MVRIYKNDGKGGGKGKVSDGARNKIVEGAGERGQVLLNLPSEK